MCYYINNISVREVPFAVTGSLGWLRGLFVIRRKKPPHATQNEKDGEPYMSKKAILEIKHAEEKAQTVRKEAADKAIAMRNAVQTQAAAHRDELVLTTEREYAARLAEIRTRAKALLEKKHEEAKNEADALRAAAFEHMDQAVEAIIWRIVEKCQ